MKNLLLREKLYKSKGMLVSEWKLIFTEYHYNLQALVDKN